MRSVERHPDAVDATVEDDLVVMNIQSLDYYRFNAVAKSIWDLLESGPLSEDAVCQALLDEYEVSEEECRQSVAEFLDDAVSRDFLRAV